MVRAISIVQPPISNIGLISTSALPTVLQDVTDKADKWGDHGENGRIDPFTEIYDVSFVFPELHIGWIRY